MKSKSEPKKLGRPPESVPADKADDIIAWVSAGKTLREWCRLNEIHYGTVYAWLGKDDAFFQRFARAREIGHEVIAEEALAIIDEEPEMATSWSKDGGSSHRDGAHITWLKNRAEMRLKLLAKWNPKKYGDKVDVNHGGGISLTVSTGIPDEQPNN
jgi:hypothetical protein